MMRLVLPILLSCAISLTSWAEEQGDVKLGFPSGSNVWEVLLSYQRLSGKPLYVATDVSATVTIQHPKLLSRSEALELIRTTLLERYGIEIRTNTLGETLVALSKDPKYPPRSDAPPVVESKGESKQTPRRIRVIEQ